MPENIGHYYSCIGSIFLASSTMLQSIYRTQYIVSVLVSRRALLIETSLILLLLRLRLSLKHTDQSLVINQTT